MFPYFLHLVSTASTTLEPGNSYVKQPLFFSVIIRLIFAEDVREKPAAAAPVPQEQENISSSSSSSSSKETVQVQSDKIVNSEPLEIKSVEPSELVVDEIRHAKIANTMQFSSEDILAAKSAIISEWVPTNMFSLEFTSRE